MDNNGNMSARIINIAILMVLICMNNGYSQSSEKPRSLFDGKDLRHWVMYGDDPGFEVKDGIIKSTVQNGDNLFTKKTFGHYTIKLEYHLSDVGNSGVLMRCDRKDAWSEGMKIQLETICTP